LTQRYTQSFHNAMITGMMTNNTNDPGRKQSGIDDINRSWEGLTYDASMAIVVIGGLINQTLDHA